MNQFDFIDYDTFCRQTANIVEQEEINGIINVCSGRPEKLSDRVERFILENNYSIKLNYGAFPDRPYDSKAIWGDNLKISIIEKIRRKRMLKNKKILFFSPAFFGYELKIKNKMEELGAYVDMFDERSVSKSYQKAILKLNPNIFNRLTEEYYIKILNQIKHKSYDFILFIKCDMPTEKILNIYKNVFPNTLFCLHMWDSLRNIPNIDEKMKYFDYISSFDRKDCEVNDNIHFRPLFYCDEYRKNVEKKDYVYDLCFIGTIHSDRYAVLKKIKQQAEEQGLSIYISLFTK